MNLLRKVKIDKLIPVLSEREKEIIVYVDSWFKELRLFNHLNTHTYFTKNGVYVIQFDDDGDALIRDEIYIILKRILTYDDTEEYLKHIFVKNTGLGRLENISYVEKKYYEIQEKEYKEYKLRKKIQGI